MKTRGVQRLDDSEITTKLWREFISNYQKVLEAEPEKFTKYLEKFRDRHLHAH